MSKALRPLRFAVLHHTGDPSQADHFDLLFETSPDGDENARALLAFATVRDVFPTGAGEGDEVVALAAHRRLYLSYEGPVSGNRGQVRRVESGESICDTRSADGLKVQLSGPYLKGSFCLKPFSATNFHFIKVV